MQHLAFQVDGSNDLPHHFNEKEGMPGYEWCYGFISCHPET